LLVVGNLLVVVEFCAGVVRSITSGAGARRQPRPSKTPKSNSATKESDGRSQCVRANAREHLSQNFLLVQTNQRSRTILWPQLQQKLGR
jgi:hypothetical protein